MIKTKPKTPLIQNQTTDLTVLAGCLVSFCVLLNGGMMRQRVDGLSSDISHPRFWEIDLLLAGWQLLSFHESLKNKVCFTQPLSSCSLTTNQKKTGSHLSCFHRSQSDFFDPFGAASSRSLATSRLCGSTRQHFRETC